MPNSITDGGSVPAVPDYNDMSMDFYSAFTAIDDMVLKNYLTRLTDMDVVPLDANAVKGNMVTCVRLFKITEMTYEKDEFASHKFASVFNAFNTGTVSVFLVIDSDGTKADFYMGVRSADRQRSISAKRKLFEGILKGQFPGTKTEPVDTEAVVRLLENAGERNVSSVSCVAGSRAEDISENKQFVQGLEKFVLSMQGQKYTCVIIADSAGAAQVRAIRREYENIYSQLSPFASRQINYGRNFSQQQSLTASRSVSDSVTHTDTHTDNYSRTEGTTVTDGVSQDNAASRVLKGIGAASSALGATIGTIIAPGIGTVIGGGIGSLASGLFSVAGDAVRKTHSHSESKNESETKGTSDAYSDGTTRTVTSGTSSTSGTSAGTSDSVTFTTHDKTVECLLERIDKQLKRMEEFESLGMFECAAYFLSDDRAATEIAASSYKSIMQGEDSGVELSAINVWGEDDPRKTASVARYIKNFIHPVFRYDGLSQNIEVTPCAMVSGSELAFHMGLPRRSVCGFPVIEHSDFGKEVRRYQKGVQDKGVNLGRVFNMGSSCPNRVFLDTDSLAMHTFITGSTGSGKSNTIYEILRQLRSSGVNFLVIEPAKGEYKNVFGQMDGVSVFGTNPAYSKLLRINPFRFPKGIHVLEHVDRLIEIFNVCWPMYAAMPAVLKEAVLRAYEVCGWDLETGENRFDGEFFPTFRDLLSELVNVIDSSSYDGEVKSNYKGSLETRVRSLTNGLNGQIFSMNEADGGILFDSNVIVDLSRVGSTETKALLMGILVIRLNEYRMANASCMNAPLKHVTVLEEAHNILKRTTGADFGPEGSGVASKSVEMLSNSIAEMRTYGEGFIIADQSPNAVDSSAIKNTNTKIIMRLPDESDRKLAGKAAGLNDGQVDEIAKLPGGVAVVYQNDWLEAVLCKVGKYEGGVSPFTPDPEVGMVFDSRRFKLECVKLILKDRVNENVDIDTELLTRGLSCADVPTGVRIRLLMLLNDYLEKGGRSEKNGEGFPQTARLVCGLLGLETAVEKARKTTDDHSEINRIIGNEIVELLPEISGRTVTAVIQCVLRDYADRNGDAGKVFYGEHMEYLRNRRG